MVMELPVRLRAAAIVNPTKVGDVEALRNTLTTTMDDTGWDAPLWLETTAEDSGHSMAAQALAEGVDLVLACGGDGTVNAVLNVLSGSGTPLGLIPTGTGNLLARSLGLPLNDPVAALQVALTGDNRVLDLGLIQPANQKTRPQRFVVMAGVGFDAAMVRDAPESLKAWMGWMAYLTSAVKHLRGQSMHVRVSIDDGPEIRARARTVMIGNFGTLPGGLDLLLDARPDDGKLDVGIIACHSLLDWLRVGSRVITRRADVDDRYLTYQGKRIRIRLNVSQPRQIDGDVIGAGRRLDVEVEPAALLVRVPIDPTSPPPKGTVMRESS